MQQRIPQLRQVNLPTIIIIKSREGAQQFIRRRQTRQQRRYLREERSHRHCLRLARWEESREVGRGAGQTELHQHIRNVVPIDDTVTVAVQNLETLAQLANLPGLELG